MADVLDYVAPDGSYQEGVYVRLDQIETNTNTATSGAQDVVIQDSVSPLYILKFSNIIAETTLTTEAAKDDYIINVASATGFVVGQYLTIFSIADNRVYFSNVLAINGTAITLDRPLDFEFPIGAGVTVGITNMNVDGSVTPQIFGIRNPTGGDIALSVDITRLMFKILTDAAPDLSKFGDIVGGITRGVQIRRVDGTYQNIVNFKTNGDMNNIMYDLTIQAAKGSQQDGLTARFTMSALGAVVRIGEGEDLQIIIQDDLTSLGSFTMIAEGSEVVN